MPPVTVRNITIGPDHPMAFIAGPCVLENLDLTLSIARALKAAAQELRVPLVFKASYDKANRSSVSSFRGPGMAEGLRLLAAVKAEVGLPLTTDVHSVEEVEAVAEVVDLLQIPAFLCRQTDLIVAAARTGRPLNVKKGQFLSPREVENIAAKAASAGNGQVLFTERGVTFGYNNLVVDYRSLVIIRELGFPVIFDATHSVQYPGGQGGASGGDRRFIPALARAAAAIPADGLFTEVYPDPNQARCDGPNSWPLTQYPDLVRSVVNVAAQAGKPRPEEHSRP